MTGTVVEGVGTAALGERTPAEIESQPAVDLADEALLLDHADETSVVQTRFPTELLLARAPVERRRPAMGTLLQ